MTAERRRRQPDTRRHLVRVARPRADRGRHLPRRQSHQTPIAARVRRPGRRAGARRGRPHRRARARSALAALVLHPPRRPGRADRVRGRSRARRPLVLSTAASSRSSTARRSSRCRRRSSSSRRASSTDRRCRTSRIPRTCRLWRSASAIVPRCYAQLTRRARPIESRYVDEPSWDRGPDDRVGRPECVDARERRAARRPVAARVRADLRLRSHAARHGAGAPRPLARARRRSRWPRSITRCGSCGRSAWTSGSSTR